jgi:threonine synthase
MSIWKYKNYFKSNISKLNQLTLNEGDTPCTKCPNLAYILKLTKVYLKREDLNPSGSFKDRSIAYQISQHLQNGENKFVISSSGNAAISTIKYCKLFPCELNVFVSKNIPADKLMRLIDTTQIQNFDHSILQNEDTKELTQGNITLYFSNNPISDSIKFVNEYNYTHLRGSNDDLATIGFRTISYELINQAKDMDSIFIPCSSGTSTVGIYQGFFDKSFTPPPIHIIQTAKIKPIASYFDKEFTKSETSLSSAISDRIAKRKDQVIEIVNKTGGSGWIINDDELITSQSILSKECNLQTSFDSALSLAGLYKALQKGYTIKKPVLIISGK